MTISTAEQCELVNASRKEKDCNVFRRIELIKNIEIYKMRTSKAAARLQMSRSWGTKWHKRYLEMGLKGLQSPPKTGRPPKVHPNIMKCLRRIARKTKMCWTAEEMKDFLFENTKKTFDLSYVRKIMKRWEYTMKVPVRRHVRRASKQRIKRFQKRLKKKIDKAISKGYTICVQDEAIVIADASGRKTVYTLKGKRAVYMYSGNHRKTIVYGLLTADKEGYFERYDKFTKDEFEKFLRNACKKMGKIFMILDRAPQHKAKVIMEAVKELDGQVILEFLPPGCPELNAIEELWRQLKMNVLQGPFVKFKKMCNDIDNWLKDHLPPLDIYRYLYRQV